MRRNVISSASLLSISLITILSLSAIYSGVGIAHADSVIATISVGSRPFGIAFDSSNGNVYVGNYNDNNVSVISGQTNTVIGSPIPVGATPFSIAFDSANGNLYVTNEGSNAEGNTVSVIAPVHSTTLTLNAIANVPSGTTITVTGKLTDNVGGAGVAGKTITFTGTGAGNIASVTTNPNGTFTATGLAPASVNNGWTVQAHFAGDSLYAPADSSVQSYNTVRTTPIPPDTTITSAVDGNGATITNGSTTFSSSIRFTFTATAGTNPVASFECSLDNSTFSSCSSPSTLTTLAGKHTFQVRAVDTSGNKDPTQLPSAGQ
jgi:YVTN family beta-propeller protein